MDSDRIFFVTTVTAHRQPIFRRDAAARLLIETLAHYRGERKYLLHEFVVMPDHLHALLTPAPQISLERAMQFIKGGFSFRLKSRPPVWQASFTNHRVRDCEDYEHHREYIRMNPVRARLAGRSVSVFVRSGSAATRRGAPGAKARVFGGPYRGPIRAALPRRSMRPGKGRSSTSLLAAL